jgi:NAD(P)-dependent dehydrogenase (short-subunit alcohol dehydrogenase family)
MLYPIVLPLADVGVSVESASVIGPDDALLTGRVAVVTGAAVGIGEAIAFGLAGFGADVAVCDRDADRLAETAAAIEAMGRRTVSGVLDVREDDQVDGWVARVGERFGRIDVVVNNAGGGFEAPFDQVSRNGQHALIRENFSSVTSVLRACLPWMNPGGSVINVTSIEAHRAGPGFAVYSAMKAAVASLTKSLAVELGERRIRVNCIAPDVIPTPGVGDLPGPPHSPLARRGAVDDVAGAAVWLAGDLSGFVTGTTVHVDGGNLAAAGWHRLEDGSFHP